MFERLLARPRLLLGTGLLVGAGALLAHPTLARSVGADVWNVPALNEQVRAAGAEEERLTEDDNDVLRRIAVKEGIVSALIAGRLTLTEATERFAELNAARPAYLPTLRTAYPGDTDQEKFARNVISFALPRVPPHERAALSARLEAELRQMLATGTAH